MKQYKHVFFDFDNTLWDFTYNSKESLNDVFLKYQLFNYFVDFEDFYEKYEENNTNLWNEYRQGLISKESLTFRRFSVILEKFEIPDSRNISQKINSDYLSLTTTKTKIIDDAYEILNYLKNKYELHILTDGFFEVQVVKLRTSKLSPFISNVITAEEIGFLKPSIELFQHALKSVNATKEESIMIGDSYESDIIGAKNAGIDQIFLNHNNRSDLEIKPTYTVTKLKEIIEIL
ncbi:MAG: YjjG family noncanonical pyrimidine nucleotidase [Bacteroidales bacterium]|nr:YjjG family noncanonical pyrimidine nucleotidase [Bacteroidales bacterium]